MVQEDKVKDAKKQRYTTNTNHNILVIYRSPLNGQREVGPRVFWLPRQTLVSERITRAAISGKKAILPTWGCHGHASMSRATTSALMACSQRAALRVFLNQGNSASNSSPGCNQAILMFGHKNRICVTQIRGIYKCRPKDNG